MAGIYIKGMQMPKSCFYCPFREKVNPDDYVCLALNREYEETFSLIAGRRNKDCPLIPVPDHGDLIDPQWVKDKMVETLKALRKVFPPGDQERHLISAIHMVGEMLDDAPTVLPEDREGEA